MTHTAHGTRHTANKAVAAPTTQFFKSPAPQAAVTGGFFVVRVKSAFVNVPETLSGIGVPEVREYQVMGVLSDEEIGQPSDIASVTYEG